ncbi:MAG: T9SS type A sorting domain-containing protein [Bacteroidia bacterium]
MHHRAGQGIFREPCRITVCDMQGRVIAEEIMNLDGSARELRLKAAPQLAPGIYMLRLRLAGESRNLRIVKR